MNFRRLLLAVFLALVCVTSTSSSFAKPANTLALVGGDIISRPGELIKGGTILIRGNTIVAVGKNVKVPRAARTVDATGKVITSGLIEASSRLGMVEVDMVQHTNEGSFGRGRGETHGDDIFAAYSVTDSYNPFSVGIPIARTGGITTAAVVPSGGLLSGQGAVFDLGTASDGAVLPQKSNRVMVATLGMESQGSGHGSRGVSLERLRELFADAGLYRRRKGGFEKNQLRSLAASHLDLEAIASIISGKSLLFVNVNRASDIRAVLSLRKRWKKLRLVLVGATEAWLLAKEIAKAKVAVLLNPSANLPGNFDRLGVRNNNAQILADAGVLVVISQLGEWANARNLRQAAGIAVGYGMSRKQAIGAITTGPAKLLGLTKHGEIRRGYRSNIVIWSGDPLEISSRAEKMFISGKEVSLHSRQGELLDRYRTLPATPL